MGCFSRLRAAVPLPMLPRTRSSRTLVLFALLLLLCYYYTHQIGSATAPLDDVFFIPSSIDWSELPDFYPPHRIKGLPLAGSSGRGPLLAVQAPTSAFRDPSAPDPRRDAVLRVFRRSWDAYREHAWLRDEMTPISGGGKDTLGGWSATLVDALDTLWITNLTTEFDEAALAVGRDLDFATTPTGGNVNVFETTIRHLGGLLSAYDLSGNEVLLAKAIELGDLLYKGFDTPNRMPVFWLNFRRLLDGSQRAGTNEPSAAAASLCLEFTRLSQLTGRAKFYDAADRVTRFLAETQSGGTRLPGLWPRMLNLRQQDAASTKAIFTMGGGADSLYEYLPKMSALMGGDPVYEGMYMEATTAALRHLLFRPMLPSDDNGRRRRKYGDVLFLGSAIMGDSDEPVLVPESQHLTCFAGGMFALGGRLLGLEEHVGIGMRLARSCAWAYSQFPTGLMPEVFGLVPCPSSGSPVLESDECPWDEGRWRRESDDTTLGGGWQHTRDPRYLLRPEAIESIFLLYRMTAKDDLRDLAWDMFQAIVAATETDLAYAAIASVRDEAGETKKQDSMESFWMGETLKYFYLIFSPPDLISLDEYVFNTEAHPFLRPR